MLDVSLGAAEVEADPLHDGVHEDAKRRAEQGGQHHRRRLEANAQLRHHAGDAVALVIARSRQALAEAIRLINLTLDPLPAVFDAEEALRTSEERFRAVFDACMVIIGWAMRLAPLAVAGLQGDRDLRRVLPAVESLVMAQSR